MSDALTDAMYDDLWHSVYQCCYRAAVSLGMFTEAAGILRVALAEIPRSNLPKNIEHLIAECQDAAETQAGRLQCGQNVNAKDHARDGNH